MKHTLIVFVATFLFLSACKKDKAPQNTSIIPWVPKDTIITLRDGDSTPVRISFTEGTYMNFLFIGNVYEGRCPTCINGQHDTCHNAGTAYTYFQVSDENGNSTAYAPLFLSCQLQHDTMGNSCTPFNGHYTIYPLRLDPYPTSNAPATVPYTMTLYIKQN